MERSGSTSGQIIAHGLYQGLPALLFQDLTRISRAPIISLSLDILLTDSYDNIHEN